MLYSDLLKTPRSCPFCEFTHNRIIDHNDDVFMTYALAPYHKHHLLVVPYRHIDDFENLSQTELVSINTLLHKGINLLKKLNYQDYTIVVRNGKKTGKTIEHLHYHIIPVDVIGDLNHVGEERKVLSEAEIEEILRDFDIKQ